MPNYGSSHTVTIAEIEAVLLQDLRPARKDRILPAIEIADFRHSESVGNTYTIYTTEERNQLLVSKCQELKESVRDPDGHFTRLDQSLSALFKCNFVKDDSDTITTIAEKAYKTLTRLPPRPLSLLDFPADLSSAYFITPSPKHHGNMPHHRSWENLQVTSFLAMNTIRMAVMDVLYSSGMLGYTLQNGVNVVAEFLAICSVLESQTTDRADLHSWFIVRAFLWSFWQRALMIKLRCNVSDILSCGFDWVGKNDYNFLEDTMPSPGLSTQEMSLRISSQGKAKYMCTWAFELLRTQPICIGMDFRLFHERYSQLHGHRDARCKQNSSEPCDGKHSDNCQRFRGMVIVDQSAHDALCEGECPKLRWDESSYRSLSGARAVSLAGTNEEEELLRYCKTSDKTIAISHVWCHGQGGRPEDGMNRCLHQRYKRVAESMGCDSYWMDTPCIPEDHQLRDEAIREINNVFASCHLTLVCDRDLMLIDIEHLTLEVMEGIIATVLVCDWNSRAWTFLEGTRGRRRIEILCKDNRTVSLSEIIRKLFDHGRIDLLNFCLVAPHLLPWNTYEERLEGTMTVTMAGTMLTYRPASRKGDEIVIWSLLVGNKLCYTAEAFWRSRIGKLTQTGFLISSAPRLRVRGLGWAPATASVALSPEGPEGTTISYPPLASEETDYLRIQQEGLVGDWFVFRFPGKPLSTNLGIYKSKLFASSTGEISELDKIRRQFLQRYSSGALLRPVSKSLVPQSGVGTTPSGGYQGRVTGTLLVVCGVNAYKSPWSKDAPVEYEWRGVYEWPRAKPMPAFKVMNILII